MSVPAAYIIVILVWSTTPLGIKWSGVGIGYEYGVALRMLIGMFALMVIARIWKLPGTKLHDAFIWLVAYLCFWQ